MSISKTRQKLVDVARQLFAKNGLENTTMNDIAMQSGKGRRTKGGALFTPISNPKKRFITQSSRANWSV